MESNFDHLLTGGELGNETYVDVLLESSASYSPSFILIGSDDLYTNLVWKSCAFEFSRISRRDRVGKKQTLRFFIHITFLK